jgi:hypothetical protein
MNRLHALLLTTLAASCGGSVPARSGDPGLQRFVVSLRGEEIGYFQIDVERNGDSLTIVEETVWDLCLMGTSRHVVMTLAARADTLMNMGVLEFSLSDGSAVISSRTVRTGNRLETVISSAGREMSMESEFEGGFLPAATDLAVAGMSWEAGESRTFPAFDPATGSVSDAVATCTGREPAVLLGDTVEASVLEIEYMGTVTRIWVDGGEIIRELDEGLGMEMTRVPPGQGGDVYSTRDLYEVFAVTSTPVSDPRRTGERRFSLGGDIDWSRFVLDYPPVQTFVDGLVCVRTAPPSTVAPYPPDVPDSLAGWLAEEPMIQVTDSSIIRTADSLAAGAGDSWQAAVAMSSFVDAFVQNSPTVSLPSSVEVLESGRGDCNEHTVLFVALARAAGLPARTCAGIVYLDGAFGYHAWPLVWVGEWVPMDPTFGQHVADATHIILAEGSLESQYVITSVMGRLSVSEVECPR